jgi:hypothetical protein
MISIGTRGRFLLHASFVSQGGTRRPSGAPCVLCASRDTGATLKRRMQYAIRIKLINTAQPRLGDGCYSVTTCRAHLPSPLATEDTVAILRSHHVMNPQQPLRFRVIGSLHLTSDDSLERDNRRDVASRHGEIDFLATFILSISSLSLCAHLT